MSLTWNIVRKDLVRFRFVLFVWILLIAGKYALFAYASGTFGDPSVEWIRRLQTFPAVFWCYITEPLIACLLAAALVFEDSPATRDPFWVTRPISGARLIAAKFLGAVLIGLVPPIALAMAWWVACGFNVTALATYGGIMAVVYFLMVTIGLACASITGGYPRFFLWGFAACAGIIATHAFFASVVVGMPGLSGNVFLLHLGVQLFFVMLISLEILFHQYLVRFFRPRLAVIAGLTLLTSAVIFTRPLGKITGWSGFSGEGPAIPGEETTRVVLAKPAAPDPKGVLVSTKIILPKGATAYVNLKATWTNREGKIWTLRGFVDNRPINHEALVDVMGLPPAADAGADRVVRFNLQHQPALVKSLTSEGVTFEGTAKLFVYQLKLSAESPLRPGVYRHATGSFTISDLVVKDREVSFVFTGRQSPVNDQRFGLSYVGLVNRRTGELLDPSTIKSLALGGPFFTPLNAVWLSHFRASFTLPVTPGWLDDATLVVAADAPGHWIERKIEIPSQNGLPASK